MIDDRDVARYREQGYIVVENVLSMAEVEALRREIDAIVARARFVTEHDEVFDLEDSHTPERPRVRRIKAPHRQSDLFRELARHPRLLGIVARLIGPDIRFQNSKLNMKTAGYGAAVEWHQDWAFYPHTNDDILAVGVMIDDMAEDNGPLMMLPGSHKGPVYSHQNAEGYFCGGIDPEASGLDFSKAVKVTGPAGSMSFHHVRMIHGSDLNHSGRNRRLLLYELTAADAWPLVGSFNHYTDFETFNSCMLAGKPTAEPRLAPVPVRLPQPQPPTITSIYQAQKGRERRFFDVYEEKTPEEVR